MFQHYHLQPPPLIQGTESAIVLQSPVAATATYLQAAEDDDFARFSNDEHLDEHNDEYYNEPRPPGSPSQSGSDSGDSVDSTGNFVTFNPIPEVRYLRFGPTETIQEL